MSDIDTSQPPAAALTYSIAQKSSVLVVSLTGQLTRDSMECLERLQAELSERKCAWVVLHFKGVHERAEQIALPTLAKVKKSIRDQGGKLRLTSLPDNLRRELYERGLLRLDECAEDLAETLQLLSGSNP